MRAWLLRTLGIASLLVAVACSAQAQIRIRGFDPPPSAPCLNQPLKCIQTSPNPGLATGAVVRIYAVYRYDSGPGAGTLAAGCGTGWMVPGQYYVAGQPVNAWATARHVLEGTDVNGHYAAISVQLEFFYIPIAGRACGDTASNECHIFAAECTTPIIRDAACWDWDTQCDLGRVFLTLQNTPAGTMPIPLGPNPILGENLWIPQHPQGRCMEWDGGPVVAVPPGCEFSYTISTQGGSSGAPVLNDQGQAVGVHTSANVDAANNPVCPNNGVYVGQLIRFLSSPVTPNCAPTNVDKTTWGRLKVIFR
jgi:hypothetical protein